MNCPKCNGKIKTLDTVHNRKEHETYRYRACTECKYEFFTVEYEIIINDRFKREWSQNYRYKPKNGG